MVHVNSGGGVAPVPELTWQHKDKVGLVGVFFWATTTTFFFCANLRARQLQKFKVFACCICCLLSCPAAGTTLDRWLRGGRRESLAPRRVWHRSAVASEVEGVLGLG